MTFTIDKLAKTLQTLFTTGGSSGDTVLNFSD
jgi:hypothetical protein